MKIQKEGSVFILFRRRRMAAFGLALSMTASLLPAPGGGEARAAERTLSLEDAVSLTLASNAEYKKIKNKMALNEVKYTEAVEAVRLKKKNMATFRWTPLLSFKFPERPDMAQEHEWQYKPFQIQTETDALRHQLTDVQYAAEEEIRNLYTEAYVLQEKADFNEERIENARIFLARGQAKRKTGEVKEADIASVEQAVASLESDQSLVLRGLETAKAKISELTGVDVATGYRFTDPFVTGEVRRDMLESLTAYTLEHDQGYYEAGLDACAALVSLDLSMSFMKAKYGGKMAGIEPYIRQAKAGEEIDGDAFKFSYDTFLKKIEEPWTGAIRILFIRIPKEWFKGSLDGVRYIEDEPYAFYSAALEYQEKRAEKESLGKELEASVSEQFEGLLTAQNAYGSLKALVDAQEKELEKYVLQNKAGELPYKELKTIQEAYEEAGLDLLEALGTYSAQLNSFNRLTCGGMKIYMEEGSLSLRAAEDGESYVPLGGRTEPVYYIRSKIEKQIFVFGVQVPEGYAVSVTHYELWIDGTQIDGRKEIEEEIRHLAFAKDNVERAAVRLYGGDALLAECEIDPMEPEGMLTLDTGEAQGQDVGGERTVAYFQIEETDDVRASITFEKATGEPIAFYQMLDENGQEMRGKERRRIEEPFVCLDLLSSSVEELRVRFFDAGGNLLYEGELKEGTLEVQIQP